jgi:hypothetical protein
MNFKTRTALLRSHLAMLTSHQTECSQYYHGPWHVFLILMLLSSFQQITSSAPEGQHHLQPLDASEAGDGLDESGDGID